MKTATPTSPQRQADAAFHQSRAALEQDLVAFMRSKNMDVPELAKPTAGAETAQNATESVAAFTHTPKAGEIPEEYPEQVWFSYGIPHTQGEVEGIKLFSVKKNEEHASLKVEVGIVNRATIERVLTADECEALARNLIDAAHHLRTNKSKVAA